MFNRRTRGGPQTDFMLVFVAVSLLSSCAPAPRRIPQSQSARAIADVVALNDRMVESLSHGDLSVLERVMAPEARINAPNNQVTTGQQVIERFRSGELAHGDYERRIEEAYVSGDVVVLMGEEVVTMRGSNQANAGQKTRRRFTSAWRKNHGRWQQFARQATNIGAFP